MSNYKDFGNLPKFYGTLKFLLTQAHMRLKISQRYSYSFPVISANFLRILATMVEYRLLPFLVIGKV